MIGQDRAADVETRWDGYLERVAFDLGRDRNNYRQA